MKWLLPLAFIGVSIFAYNQRRALDEEQLNLEKAQAQIAALETQIQKVKKENPISSPFSGSANSPSGNHGPSGFGGTALDQPKDSVLGRGRK